MRRILLVPDSFKGTLTSRQVCGVMQTQLERFFPRRRFGAFPLPTGERAAWTLSSPPLEAFEKLSR